MGIANFIADILGILFVVIPFSLFANSKQIGHIFSALENEFTMYMNGIGLFLAGIIIVLLHNVWELKLVVAVTIAGWLLIVKGLFILFFTKDSIELMKKYKESKLLPYLLLVVFFIGLKFLYIGFVAK